jgi:hypothetical protein
VGSWYWIGVAAGFGTALGVAAGAVLGASAARAAVAAAIAALLGVAVGLALPGSWPEAIAGGVGGVLGAIGICGVVGGALRTGGTRAGTAMLLVLGAIGLAALALVPGLGYVEAVTVPVLGARLRQRTARRYAGLRSLAD